MNIREHRLKRLRAALLSLVFLGIAGFLAYKVIQLELVDSSDSLVLFWTLPALGFAAAAWSVLRGD